METKINIAEILKDKPEGTKLWTDMFGSVTLYVVTVVCDAFQVKHHNKEPWFDKDGKLYKEGVLCIYPSKSMRDWEKFTWKKNDVLVNSSGFKIFFDRWANDDYTRFFGKVNLLENSFSYETEKYTLASKDENLDTLEIEKPEFKDGDIVFMKGIKGGYFANCIFILRSEYKDGDERAFYYAFYNADDKFTTAEYGYTIVHYSLRPATDSEKQQLFDALAKKGKRWDAEKKKVVDLMKPKAEFKPFDKVLCRNSKDDTWEADFFARLTRKEIDYTQSGKYLCVGDLWMYCIPYNEETAHLLGTTDEWKGGEQ